MKHYIRGESRKFTEMLHNKNRWYAGASVEFETNKGRVVSYHPYLKTGIKEQVVTCKAKPGKKIVMLKIK